MAKYIVIELGKETYAIGIEHVQSIERVLPITRVPGTSPFVRGVTSLRGVVTSVIDPKVFFGIDSASEITGQSRIVVVNAGDVTTGLIVDSANNVVDITDEDIQPVPEVVGSVRAEFLKGIATVNGTTLAILDLDAMLQPQRVADQ